MDNNTESFGVRLRALIENRRQSIDAFADAFGIARSTAHNWLNLKRPPLEKNWKRLSEYFGVSENYLAYGVPQRSAAATHSAVSPGPLVEEAQAPFRNAHPETLEKSVKHNPLVGRNDRVEIRSQFQPPPALPTRADCLAHVHAYLDAAAQIPGGYVIALHKIKRGLPLDEFESAEKDSPT